MEKEVNYIIENKVIAITGTVFKGRYMEILQIYEIKQHEWEKCRVFC